MLRTLANFIFSGGYDSSGGKFTNDPNTMAAGSANLLITGSGKNTVFKGLGTVGSAVGSQILTNAGDSYAGLGNGSEASSAFGSVFKVLGSLFYIGAGRLFYAGTDTTDSASSALSLKLFTSGSLGVDYQAGLAQPSAPTIAAVTAPTGLTGKNNGVVSVKIARVRSATGARSVASLSSNVVTATNQSIAITFPAVDANGQDYWEIDVTKNGEGAVGNHFFLQELPESVITATVTANATTNTTVNINVPNGTLTSSNIGWQYTSAGDTTTYVTAVGAANSGGAGFQQITLAAASVLSTTQSATFTRAVDGTLRTFVVEWKDADIIGSDLAPIRDYPPPAGLFGGVSEDVVFVDGALGDTVNTTRYAIDNSISRAQVSATYRGTAIAVSDPARPESFPYDNYIFTSDGPTAILQGGAGIHWRFGKNSLGIIRYIGGSPALSYERVWTGIGIANQRNACLGAGGRLYAYTGARGAVRLGMGGEPDTTFAAPVSDDMASWTAANVVLAYDPANQYVMFMHGRTILCFYEPLGIWCPPVTIFPDEGTREIRSAVPVDGRIYITVKEAPSTLNLHTFNVDDGTDYTGTAFTQWQLSQGATDSIHRLHTSVRADNTSYAVSVSTYRNGSGTATTTQSVTPSATGFQHLKTLKPNTRQCKSWRAAISVRSQGGDAGVESLRVEGQSTEIPV